MDIPADMVLIIDDHTMYWDFYYLFYLLQTKNGISIDLSQADGLRYCTAAAFSSLKKYAAHFSNPGLAETEEKEAAHTVAGVNSENAC